MKKLNLLILSFVLISCAHKAEKKTLSQLQIDRVDETNLMTSTGMPNFYIDKKLLVEKIKRRPASVVEESVDHSLSNKKVYFLTLLGQHYRLKNILNKENTDVKHCPAYHQQIVTHEEYISHYRDRVSSLVQKDYEGVLRAPLNLPYYPELSLPMPGESGNVYQTVDTEASSNQVIEYLGIALEEHYQRNLAEVKTLCEEGESDNYYVFENLMRRFKSDPDFSKTITAAKAVLKVPVFANLLLLKSIDQKTNRFAGTRYEQINYVTRNFGFFERILVSRMKVTWFDSYVQKVSMKSKKNNFLVFRNR